MTVKEAMKPNTPHRNALLQAIDDFCMENGLKPLEVLEDRVGQVCMRVSMRLPLNQKPNPPKE